MFIMSSLLQYSLVGTLGSQPGVSSISCQSYNIWSNDQKTSTKEFETLSDYGMLRSYLDKNFPFECMERTDLPMDNMYTTAKDVDQYWRYIKQNRKIQWKESRRYWVTTGIALAALIKSFLPEIAAGLAWLSKLLAQQ